MPRSLHRPQRTPLLRLLASILLVLISFVPTSFVLTSLLGTPRAAHAQGIIFVNDNASGANNGTSWADAFVNLQSALSTATAGKEIWVATGAYIPGLTLNSTFQLKNGVAIYGGFAGNESSREQRDWNSNLSLLVGPSVYHVVMGNSLNASAVLDGFTINGGRANGPVDNCPDRCGAGMYLDESSPTLANLIFTNNWAKYGGGMTNNHSSNPTLTNVTFDKNETYTDGRGGGMFNYQSSPTLINVTFRENKAKLGAGIANYIDGNPTLINVTFEDNETYAEGLGGGMYSDSSSPILTGVLFTGNLAGSDGGGMYNDSSDPTVTDVSFIGNQANPNNGGGMYNDSSDPTLTNVSFIGNYAKNAGGGMANQNSDPTLTNVSFSGNRTDTIGGGLYNTNSNPTLTNVTVSGNEAQFGAGIYLSASSPLIQNSIIWGNGASAAANIEQGMGSATIRFSIVEGGVPSGSTNGGNNLTVHPAFVRAVNCGGDGCGVGNNDDFGDLRLQSTSPAIDAGDNNADLNGAGSGGVTISAVESDLNGDPRIAAVKTLPATVDMGAYEYVNSISARAGGPYSGNEGDAIALNGSASSDEVSISSFAWDCTDDGSVEATSTSPTGSSCTYPNDGTYTLRLTATDNVGLPGSATAAVTIANVLPVLTDAPNQSTSAGTAKNFTLGSFSDPGADAPWQVVIEWGDDGPTTQLNATSAGALPATPHTYAAQGTYNVVVTVSEAQGSGDQGSDSGGFQVVVNAPPPGTPIVTAPANQSAAAGAATSFALGSFSDGGDAGPWQVTVNWGDGSAETIFNTNSTGALLNQSHTYATAGTYNVLVTVSDGDLAASASFQVTIEAPPSVDEMLRLPAITK